MIRGFDRKRTLYNNTNVSALISNYTCPTPVLCTEGPEKWRLILFWYWFDNSVSIQGKRAIC